MSKEEILEQVEEETQEEQEQPIEEEKQQPPEDETEEIIDLPKEGKVKLQDGTVVTVEELLNGYMRQDDYTKKTQEVAEIRHQLELAQENLKSQPTSQEKQEIKEDLQAQKKEIEEALGVLDELDPQAKVLKGLYRNVNTLLEKVEAIEKKEKEVEEQENYEKQVQFFQKLTKEAMEETSRNFNLPTFKDPKTGEEIDFKKDWERDVLAVLATIDENMTVPEYKNLIRKIGQKAYERQRSKIAAISAHYAESKKKPPIQKGSGAEEGKKIPEKLSLEEKIERKLDELERQKGG